jgi:hypothetical protein
MRRVKETVEAQQQEAARMRLDPEWIECNEAAYQREVGIGGDYTASALMVFVSIPRTLFRDTSKPGRYFVRAALARPGDAELGDPRD